MPRDGVLLAAMEDAGVDRLSTAERTLLGLPWLGGLVFGLGPLLAPAALAQLTGYTNDDEYIGRLAGAATLGYAVALWPALRGEWSRGVQSIVAAVLIFNLTSIVDSGQELIAGRACGPTRPVLGQFRPAISMPHPQLPR